MIVENCRTSSWWLEILVSILGCTAAAAAPAQDAGASTTSAQACKIDLRRAGHMSDVVSNALTRGLKLPAHQVRSFLADAHTRFANGQELLAAAARHFDLEGPRLASEVERFRHCNCTHEGGELYVDAEAPDAPKTGGEVVQVSPFAADVVLHVVLHELGHALVREFDLPVLGNEETMADAFATHFLTTHLPDRAAAVLEARTRSLMLEAGEVPREEWPVRGEHDNDARRAFQIAALAIAADAVKYTNVAKVVAMTDADLRRAQDYGAEIHRSWRRMLAPLWMTGGALSTEGRVVCDDRLELAGGSGATARAGRASSDRGTVRLALASHDSLRARRWRRSVEPRDALDHRARRVRPAFRGAGQTRAALSWAARAATSSTTCEPRRTTTREPRRTPVGRHQHRRRGRCGGQAGTKRRVRARRSAAE